MWQIKSLKLFSFVSFALEKLSGMNESSLVVDVPHENCNEKSLVARVLQCSRLAVLPSKVCTSSTIYRFSGCALSSGFSVLVAIGMKEDGKASKVTVNCEKMTINSILAKELAASIKKVS